MSQKGVLRKITDLLIYSKLQVTYCDISIYIIEKAATICEQHTTEQNASGAIEGRVAPEMDARIYISVIYTISPRVILSIQKNMFVR